MEKEGEREREAGGSLETAATVRRMQMMTSHNTTLRDEDYRQCVRTDRSRSTAVPSRATRRDCPGFWPIRNSPDVGEKRLRVARRSL